MAPRKITEINPHLNTKAKRIARVSDSVYVSNRIEGVRISRKEAKAFATAASNSKSVSR